MTSRLVSAFTCGLLGAMLPAFGADTDRFAAPQPVEVITTERLSFHPGGTIHIDDSYGYLHIEGTDQPEVVVTVTKKLPFDLDPKHPEKNAPRLDAVRVTEQKRSETELAISTTKGHVGLTYEIQVPRNSNLVIHHKVGYVSVSEVTGDVEGFLHRGDIVLWLLPGSYSIDARSKLGKVTSEFPGDSVSRFLVGQGFLRTGAPPSHRLFLRVGFGGVTVQPSLPESDAPPAPGR